MPVSKEMLLSAPSGQIDDSMKAMIREWPENPSARDILKTLDMGVHSSLCSDFVVSVMNIMLQEQIKAEGTTYEDVVATAEWRK